MAGISGPVSTLPGSLHQPPAGAMCDDHPDRPALKRIQGETDSFGAEYHDACEECVKQYLKQQGSDLNPGQCDWCHQEVEKRRPMRDFEEGACGPVYEVCDPCREKQYRRMEEF